MPHADADRPRPEAFSSAVETGPVDEPARRDEAAMIDARTRLDSPTPAPAVLDDRPAAMATPLPPTPPVREREEVRHVDASPRPLGFSFSAGFFGWAVASFFTLVLTLLVLALLGGEALADGGAVTNADIGQLTMLGLVGGVVALFVAYFLGGFAAGRIGIVSGALHGATILVWTILFGVLAWAGAAYAADALDLTVYAFPFAIDWAALTTEGVVALVVSLLAMIAGAVLGGMVGAREWLGERIGVTTRRTMRRGRTV